MFTNKTIAMFLLGLLAISGSSASAASVKANISASQSSVASSNLKIGTATDGTLLGKNNKNSYNRGLYIQHYRQVTMSPDRIETEFLLKSDTTGSIGTKLVKGTHYLGLNPAGAGTSGTIGSGELKTN